MTNFEDVNVDAFKAIAVPIQDRFAAENNMENYLDIIRSEGEKLKQENAQ